MSDEARRQILTDGAEDAIRRRAAEPRPYDNCALIVAAMKRGSDPARIERALSRPPAVMLRNYGIGNLSRERAALPECAARLMASEIGIPLDEMRRGGLVDDVFSWVPGIVGIENRVASDLKIGMVSLIEAILNDTERVRAQVQVIREGGP